MKERDREIEREREDVRKTIPTHELEAVEKPRQFP